LHQQELLRAWEDVIHERTPNCISPL